MSERKVKARATAVRARDADYTRKARAKKRRVRCLQAALGASQPQERE